MKILFICKYNRFRSKVAEALFNKYNKNKVHEAKSAGVIVDIIRPFVSQIIVVELSKMRAEVAEEKSQQVNDSLIEWADKIIIVADNVPVELFPREKSEVWPVKDASELDVESTRRSMKDIDKRMKEFVKKIN